MSSSTPQLAQHTVVTPTAGARLAADPVIPGRPAGVVLFAHGSGSSHELAVVPGAGHLFEEPGALERVSELAAEWFASTIAADPR